MKGLLVFAALVAVASAWGKWSPGLKVRYDVGLGVGRTFFISLPETINEAKRSRWVETTRAPDQPMQSLSLFTPSIDDVVVGTFYDDTGYVAGIQIALAQHLFTGAVLDWKKQGFVEWTAPPDSTGNEWKYWVTAQFFISEESLSKSPAERMAARAGKVGSARFLQEDYIYVSGFDGELMAISTDSRKIADTSNSKFTRQSCALFKGRHYYYNYTANLECKAETHLPWFTLVDQTFGVNQLIGTGFMTFGQLPSKSLIVDYFERPSRTAVWLVAPDGPECMYNLVDTVGMLSMHIYYIDSPLLIQCLTT